MLAMLTPYFRLFQIAGLCLLLALGYYGYRQAVENSRLRAEKTDITNYYAAAQDTLTRLRDKAGRETVVYRPGTISPGALAALRVGLAAELRDGLRAEFGRSARLLYGQQATTITTQQLPTVALKDTVFVTRPGRPPTTAKAGVFRDEWLSLTGIVTKDSMSVRYTIRNEMKVRAYSKRDKKYWFQFWKPRRVYVDLKNANPNTSTPKMEAVLVEKK